MRCALALLSVAAIASAAAPERPAAATAILGAFGDEVRLIVSTLEDRQEQKVEGILFWTGRLRGRRVVVALTGVGKVNAAITATLLHHHFHPAEVLFTGIAGGLNPALLPADIIIAEQTFQHDLGRLHDEGMTLRGTRNPVDHSRNPTHFPADKRLVAIAQQAAKHIALDRIETAEGKRSPKVITGTVTTGDVFVASPRKSKQLHETFGADAVEMEGAAVAQVCWQWNVPCLVIRSISDRADDNAARDARLFRRIAAHNSATLVAEIVARLHPPPAGK
ncbi:5'-methylthioadenosine/adenosylhomocysteine nucleosidase [bacterium]|nr:5'-methylthioadenosine/adenosylhomocysteine nucleosidase [bacterium]